MRSSQSAASWTAPGRTDLSCGPATAPDVDMTASTTVSAAKYKYFSMRALHLRRHRVQCPGFFDARNDGRSRLAAQDEKSGTATPHAQPRRASRSAIVHFPSNCQKVNGASF